MTTLVCFHAHPDDEAIATGGTMARVAAAGHRVVLVTATRGEGGEIVPGVLRPGEELWERREQETAEAARILGVARQEFLGYRDSGMVGTADNDDPRSFWSADVDEAAGRLAAILTDEHADVLTIYDEHGTYGHPDHIQVHRVGVRAAARAGTPRVYMATQNRDALRQGQMARAAEGASAPEGVEPPDVDALGLGVPEARITTAVDVRAQLDTKRRAMQAHASQIADTSFFLALPPAVNAAVFGTEWYVRLGVAPPADPSGWETSIMPDGS